MPLPKFVGDVSAITELIFYLFVFVYIIFSAILVYHWKSYATNGRVVTITFVSYFCSTLLLIAVAGSALLTM